MSLPTDADLPTVELRQGRRFPYVTGGEWVVVSAASRGAKALYFVLRSHVNRGRGDDQVWPTQEVLADLLGISKPERIKPLTDELVALGAVETERVRYARGMRQRLIYTVHEAPPQGYAGPLSLADYYRARTPENDKTPGQPDTPKSGGSGTPKNGGSRPPKNGGGTIPNKNHLKENLPPSPPSVRRDAGRGVGTEDESAAKNTIDGQGDDDGAAAVLVADAIRRWHSDHAAPNARDRARLVARVRTELTAGGDPVVITHELTRDLHPSQAGSAVKVVMGARTREPGWGRADDPRPDHSRHEVRTKTPWCGRCDERTRLVVALGADGDERMRRCPDCHPERATDAPESPAGAVPSPPPLGDLMRDLNGSGVSGAGHDDGSDDDGGTGSARSLPAAVAEVRALLERQRATV